MDFSFFNALNKLWCITWDEDCGHFIRMASVVSEKKANTYFEGQPHVDPLRAHFFIMP